MGTVILVSVLAVAVFVGNSLIDPSEGTETEYTFILNCSDDDYDYSISGTYTASGATVTEALVSALETSGIDYDGFSESDTSIAFDSSVSISDWSLTSSYYEFDGSGYGMHFVVWCYNPTDGWHLAPWSQSVFILGSCKGDSTVDTAYLISFEEVLCPDMGTSLELGVDIGNTWPDPAEYDLVYDGITGNYPDALTAIISCAYSLGDVADYGLTLAEPSNYEDADSAYWDWMAGYSPDYTIPDGLRISDSMAYVYRAPADLSAQPDDVVYGRSVYTFILDCNSLDYDLTVNGTCHASGTDVVEALTSALDSEGIECTLHTGDNFIIFDSSTSISDWQTHDEGCGMHWVIWCYNPVDGWHIGPNTNGLFHMCSCGSVTDTAYVISFENVTYPDSNIACFLGVDNTDVWPEPANYGLDYDGSGEYLDIKQAIAAWYYETNGIVDPGDYGIIYNPDNDLEGYADAFEAALTVLGERDPELYVIPEGLLLSDDGFLYRAPIDYCDEPERVSFGPFLSERIHAAGSHCMISESVILLNIGVGYVATDDIEYETVSLELSEIDAANDYVFRYLAPQVYESRSLTVRISAIATYYDYGFLLKSVDLVEILVDPVLEFKSSCYEGSLTEVGDE